MPGPYSALHLATKPMKTILAHFDNSKEFDRIWREDLLIRPVDIGLPIKKAKWLRNFQNPKRRSTETE